MTDFWPGQDPFNSFDQSPGWDSAGEPDRARSDDGGAGEAPAESPRDVAFVQAAIQRVYHP